jgi:rhamnogalacturonyl hydrolase YesR
MLVGIDAERSVHRGHGRILKGGRSARQEWSQGDFRLLTRKCGKFGVVMIGILHFHALNPAMKCFLPLLFAPLALFPATLPAAAPDEGKVMAEMRRVADWQLANPSKHPVTDWTQAPFYLGLLDLAQVGGGEKYQEAVKAFGSGVAFGPGKRIVHADDHAVLQAWLTLHEKDRDAAKLTPSIRRFDELMAKLAGKPAVSISGGTFTLSWCDTLFMSPPTWARLSRITGNDKFLAWADREWWTCTDVLYDPQHALYYRDNRFFDQRTPSGRKTFWARGNGWVIGGLVHMLDLLPADHPSREKYLGLYHDMMHSIVRLQGADGLWRTSLLEPEGKDGEASGTAFFVYGMAWGLNRGLLPEETFRPAMEKGWAALEKCVQPSGMLGFIQRIGDRPGAAGPESTEVYGSGAFLLAGSEILRGIDPSKRKSDVADFKDVRLPERFLPQKPRVHVRYVPERSDDFALENDLVAFRFYGPALRPGAEDGGIDAWLKRVPYPVMDKWFIEDVTPVSDYHTAECGHKPKFAPKSYHADQGEGYDAYKVGDTRGCGGIALWIDGQPANLETYAAFRILENTPERARFELDHVATLKDGRIARERKHVTIVMGSRLIQCDSVFTLDGKPGSFDVAIGLKHQGGAAKFIESREKGRFALWETLDGLGLGTGVVIDPARVTGTQTHGDGDARQSLILAKTGDDGRIRWFTGFGWEGQGEIKTEADWSAYLGAFAAKPYFEPEVVATGIAPPAP